MTTPPTSTYQPVSSKALGFVCGEEGLYTLDTVITTVERYLRTSAGSNKDLVRISVEGVAEPQYRNNMLLSLRDISGFILLDYRGPPEVRTERDLVGKPVRAFYRGTRLIGIQSRDSVVQK